ncbi:MAG TPA: hypothetical protein VMN78_08420 [Longimicrobiales bacterium]|nr:hypothetical protein [Longimicrobiales bacterium]
MAQDTTEVPIGSRVRVALLPGGTMRGVLASSHPDSVALQSALRGVLRRADVVV